MPYIKNRKQFNELIEPLFKIISTKGELNYSITVLLHAWVTRQQNLNSGKLSYKILSNAVSVLQDVGDEFKRTVFAKYESKKRMETSPISDLDSKTLNDVR